MTPARRAALHRVFVVLLCGLLILSFLLGSLVGEAMFPLGLTLVHVLLNSVLAWAVVRARPWVDRVLRVRVSGALSFAAVGWMLAWWALLLGVLL